MEKRKQILELLKSHIDNGTLVCGCTLSKINGIIRNDGNEDGDHWGYFECGLCYSGERGHADDMVNCICEKEICSNCNQTVCCWHYNNILKMCTECDDVESQ